MKKIFLFLVCLISALSQAQVYDYPVKPGSEEWGKLKTEADRFAVLQIPENLLKTMNTHDLVVTCLNYPSMVYFTAFNDTQKGIEFLVNKFNGLQELMRRDDAFAELFSIYKQMDSRTLKLQGGNINQSSWSIRRVYFELLLTQDCIINRISDIERTSLIEEIRNKFYQKADNPEEFSRLDYLPTLKLLNVTLSNSKKVKQENSVEEILVNVFQSVDSKYNPVYAKTTIYTPNGTAVPVLKLVGGELTKDQKEQTRDDWMTLYSNRIIYVSESTFSYNCHAYAWYISEGKNDNVWLENDPVAHFWRDGSYVYTTTPTESCKVYFLGGNHSAVMTSYDGSLLYKSKWGEGPVFIHSKDDCPYGYESMEYYKGAYAPSRPLAATFDKTGAWEFSASATCNSQYPVTMYEWRADYPSDWSIVGQNSTKSSVKIYGSSNPRSCNLSVRACNKYGWGDWQVVGWLYASSSYSLSVAQNPVNAILQVQITPAMEAKSVVSYDLSNQEYKVGLYSNTGTCVYQADVNGDGNNPINVNIDVSPLSNGIYILHVKDKRTSEKPQTFNVVVKH
ncbi:T9SS type A sorting domain-containing protein [Parabacteroides sp.]|uniref:T9SS type A sorting domain-containing protein n=1 Tax=Parabacteroides sp. TaxID=1869337 RepID=UPI00257C3994|nr:T9SS type A sorting domain-containing protein [Parabacteroides sp.]